MIEEDKYKAFQELVKYPDDLMKDLAKDIQLLEKIESTYVELTFEIDRNKYQALNKETFKSYLIDRLDYVALAIDDLVKYHDANFLDWAVKYGLKDYRPIFESVRERLLEIGKRATDYKEGLLEIENGKMENRSLEKIKWLGNAEQFGFIFGELAAKGYIELPTKEGEGTITGLAELCSKYFEINAAKGRNAGKPTTKENLERALNPESNLLSVKGKANLKLPPLKDLK